MVVEIASRVADRVDDLADFADSVGIHEASRLADTGLGGGVILSVEGAGAAAAVQDLLVG